MASKSVRPKFTVSGVVNQRASSISVLTWIQKEKKRLKKYRLNMRGHGLLGKIYLIGGSSLEFDLGCLNKKVLKNSSTGNRTRKPVNDVKAKNMFNIVQST